MNNHDSKKPKVCVIMPVYNGEKTLKYALASLLRQSYQNWICVIVNDGSIDDTRLILDSLDDTRFKVYHLERNRGRGYARDIALSHAEGDYLCYLDADDMLHRDKIQIQVDYMEQHPDIRLVTCGYVRIKEDMTACGIANCSLLELKSYRYGDPMPMILPASMVRLSMAMKYSYDSFLDVGEDFDYFSRYCDKGKVISLPNPYYFYMTGNVTTKKLFYYQWNSLRVGVSMLRNKIPFKGIKYIAVRLAKIAVYSVLIPIFGTDRIVNEKRYKKESIMVNFDDYNAEYRKIKQVVFERMGGVIHKWLIRMFCVSTPSTTLIPRESFNRERMPISACSTLAA